MPTKQTAVRKSTPKANSKSSAPALSKELLAGLSPSSGKADKKAAKPTATEVKTSVKVTPAAPPAPTPAPAPTAAAPAPAPAAQAAPAAPAQPKAEDTKLVRKGERVAREGSVRRAIQDLVTAGPKPIGEVVVTIHQMEKDGKLANKADAVRGKISDMLKKGLLVVA